MCPSKIGLRTFIMDDLPLVSNIFTMLMYADDTTLYCNVNNDVTDDILNYELNYEL